MILTILSSAGARNAPQLGVKALFHFRFVRSEQIHPVGRKYAAR
jgi:hypothetical protein